MGFPSVRGKRVLIFGDSLTHRPPDNGPRDVTVTETSVTRSSAPGDLLASYALRAGASSARIHAKVGRSAHNFWTSWEPDHDAVMQSLVDWQPDIVIVALGTNDAGLNMKVDGDDMKNILGWFWESTRADVWALGPPSFPTKGRGSVLSDGRSMNAEVEKVYAMLREAFGPDHVIDGRPLTTDILTTAQGRAGDGIHFQPAGSQKYAGRLAVALGLTAAAEPPVVAAVPLARPALRASLGGVTLAGSLIGLMWVIFRRSLLAAGEVARRMPV